MTSIETLLGELAPHGVSHLRLGDVASLSSSRATAGTLDSTTYIGVDNLLPNFGGRRDAGHGVNSSGAIAFGVGDILIGNIRPYLKKVWLADRNGGASPDVLVLSIDRACIGSLLPRFLYFVLASERFIDYSMLHAKGAKMPRGSKAATLDYKVPVPPLKVQREVVRILDGFSELESELEAALEAELDARRRQHAYYRDRMFDFSSTDIRWIPLGDAVGNLDNQRRPVTRSDRSNGVYPYYGANGVQDYVEDYLFDGTFLLMGEDGSVVQKNGAPVLNWATGKIWVNNHAHVLKEKSADVRLRFVYHYLQTLDISSFVTGGTQPKLNQGNMNRIAIPVPQVEEQDHIVSVLDKFDALVNDLSIGLPAELAARRTQYEYYRDKLLTFEEAPA